jgi:hypothetical protein
MLVEVSLDALPPPSPPPPPPPLSTTPPHENLKLSIKIFSPRAVISQKQTIFPRNIQLRKELTWYLEKWKMSSSKYFTKIATIAFWHKKTWRYEIKSWLWIWIWKKYSQERNCTLSHNVNIMCLWAIYIFPRFVCLFCCRKICGPILGKYLNRSQTHECGNWDWSRAIPFLGMHKWDFCCSV